MTSFKTVVLDVDSTLCGVEGIDWLAARKGDALASKVAALTEAAMEGRTPLEEVYGARLSLVAPSQADVAALGDEYVRSISPGAEAALTALMSGGINIHLISGGLLPAIRPVAKAVGIQEKNVHAVDVHFSPEGSYENFDAASPLARQGGKKDVLASLALERPVLMVGDGMTDAEARPVVDAFAAFTGFTRREAVVQQADHVLSSFSQLLTLVMT